MITRYPLQIKDVLYSEHLCCYPAENQAAKIYAKFLAEHPEFTSKDVDMYIACEEREEDHYGNGGGVDRTCIIYKSREETEEECAARVRNEEQEVIHKYSNELFYLARNFSHDLLGRYIEVESDENKKKCFEMLFDTLRSKLNIQ
jgi:hypothetical protein